MDIVCCVIELVNFIDNWSNQVYCTLTVVIDNINMLNCTKIDKYAELHRYRWIIKYAKSETIEILNKHIWRHDTGATSKLTYSRRENYRLIFLREISSNNYRSISNYGRTVDAISFLAHFSFWPDDLSFTRLFEDGKNLDGNVLNVFFSNSK